jgi:hypothetical protein
VQAAPWSESATLLVVLVLVGGEAAWTALAKAAKATAMLNTPIPITAIFPLGLKLGLTSFVLFTSPDLSNGRL